MKTIRQHLDSLPPLYRDLALYEAEKYTLHNLDRQALSLSDAIYRFMPWIFSGIGEYFWQDLHRWVVYHYTEPIRVHKKEKTAASQAILDENKVHFKASTRKVLIELLKGNTLDKHSGISGNISSRCSDLIRENGVPIIKGRKEKNGKLLYFTYSIAPEHRADIAKRFKLKI